MAADDSQQAALPGRDYETVAREALEMAAKREYDQTLAMVSGGTDSLVALDIVDRFGAEYGIEVDAVLHINTGAALPSTQATVREFCADRGIPFIEGINKTEGERLAHRVLEHGWPSAGRGSPSAGGHWFEYINRKERVFDAAYMGWHGDHLWISGARHAESDQRASNVGDSPVDFGETGGRKPRQSWLCPAHGLTDDEKAAYIDRYDIPETAAYDWFGYSAECLACAFDDPRILNELWIVAPNLAYALASLCVWVYQRSKSGRSDVPIHRSVWGWDPKIEADQDDDQDDGEDVDQRTMDFAGCGDCSKSCYADVDAADVAEGGAD